MFDDKSTAKQPWTPPHLLYNLDLFNLTHFGGQAGSDFSDEGS
jgi:hypothetical protein